MSGHIDSAHLFEFRALTYFTLKDNQNSIDTKTRNLRGLEWQEQKQKRKR